VPPVFLTRRAKQALDELAPSLADAVLEAIADLRHDIQVGARLHGRFDGLWSLAVGAYRVIYEARDDGTLRVLAIRHRASAYRTDPRG
jgi:mRNA interferase RelE/StbE